MSDRRCGDCTACCTALGVPTLDKPAFSACSHLRSCPAGCAIYASRPAECASFRCGWLDGVGSNADRPDRSGVILSATDSRSLGISYVQAHEVRPGAAETGRGRALVDLARRAVPLVVILRPNGSRSLVGAPEVIDRVRSLLAQTGKSEADVGWTEIPS